MVTGTEVGSNYRASWGRVPSGVGGARVLGNGDEGGVMQEDPGSSRVERCRIPLATTFGGDARLEGREKSGMGD